jgi:UDP-galactopyranose mutase
MTTKKILVVGAGFSGLVVSRVLAEHGFHVDIIEKRSHIAGNAYDYINDHGIRIHKYGPHLFHTSNLTVVDWLSRFTEWIEYKHKVKAMLHDGTFVTLPVNIDTINIVGRDNIIDTFYRPYSLKMWGIPIEKIDKSIFDRVPIREDRNEYYFPNDSFQALPRHGYTNLCENIIDHCNINLNLDTPYDLALSNDYAHTFNSMPIDEFFGFKHGMLQYRSIKFHSYTIPVPYCLPVATVNFTHAEPFTRVTEWKRLPNSNNAGSYFTTLTVEEPCDALDNDLERYYPVKDTTGINESIHKLYKLETPSNVTFIGRCGLYAYLDMHQAISSAISFAKQYIATKI